MEISAEALMNTAITITQVVVDCVNEIPLMNEVGQ
jgi:hypothetical protein